MNRRFAATLTALSLAALLAGCASSPPNVSWSRQSVRDTHAYMPSLYEDPMKPSIVLLAGADGRVVPAGTAANRIVSRDGMVMLVSAPAGPTLAEARR